MEPKTAAAIEPKAPQPGPTQEDMAAAQQMTPDQRQEMIRGMVDRLAERLKTDASDFEGWLRLVRAYAVMGDRDKARERIFDRAQHDRRRRREAQTPRRSREGAWH